MSTWVTRVNGNSETATGIGRASRRVIPQEGILAGSIKRVVTGARKAGLEKSDLIARISQEWTERDEG